MQEHSVPGNDVDANPPPPAGAPASWYADPWRQSAMRWWDGVRWTGYLQPVPVPPGGAPSKPVAWWILVASAVGAGFAAVGAIAPAQNGSMDSSESTWWLVLCISVGLTALSLVLASRLRAGRNVGVLDARLRTLVTVAMVGLAVLAGFLLVALALSIGSGDSFTVQVDPSAWILGYGIAIAFGVGVGSVVPVRPVTARVSRDARVSLVASFLGLALCFGVLLVPSIVGVVAGHRARGHAAAAPSPQADRDYAMVGLVAGYLGLAYGLLTWAYNLLGN